MGFYVNPGTDKFEMSLLSNIYVDKSNLIAQTNALFRTNQRYICISRPRRFGKTMAANMLAAYYGYNQNAGALFNDLDISTHPTYEKYLNNHDVIMVNMQEFLSKSKLEAKKEKVQLTVDLMLHKLTTKIMKELKTEHADIVYDEDADFFDMMNETYFATKRPFVILIDEWDCLFREYKNDTIAQDVYLDFLRLWLKDQAYVGLAYMTGILPIKKYGTHSALNMFREYTMTNPRMFLNYFGFSESEVSILCKKYDVNLEEIRAWYNGYFLDRKSPIYNPTSVVECLESAEIANYWNKTETYEALRDHIILNYDGMKDKVTQLIAGDDIVINPNKFSNDMTTFHSVDDIFTLLVHLGYLTYNFERSTVRIPNEEVKCEFINSIEDSEDWKSVVTAIKSSKKLLEAIWNREEDEVAKAVQKVHEENASIIKYNDENSLSSILSLALYAANNYYTIFRELPSGKGYADLAFIPRKKFIDKPAMIVELKWNKTAKSAIEQIKVKNYPSALAEYAGSIYLVAINYDKESKRHACLIEVFDDKS